MTCKGGRDSADRSCDLVDLREEHQRGKAALHRRNRCIRIAPPPPSLVGISVNSSDNDDRRKSAIFLFFAGKTSVKLLNNLANGWETDGACMTDVELLRSTTDDDVAAAV